MQMYFPRVDHFVGKMALFIGKKQTVSKLLKMSRFIEMQRFIEKKEKYV